ncbi:MAG: alginate export family protein [Burkholderiales bacterium]
MRGRQAVVASLLSLVPASVVAEDAPECPVRRPLPNMRYEEDWRFLSNRPCRTDPWDRVKYVPLGPDRYASLGGEARLRYERFENGGFGRDPDDRSGYVLQRYLVHGDLRLDRDLRVFAQVESSLENGRKGGPRANDENRLDVNQGFVEWSPHRQDRDIVTLRFGRQEVELGSSQFTSARNGLNDRQSFDGIRAFGEIRGWRFHGMATRVVPTVRGTFDDETHPDETLSGVFLARSHALLPGGNAVVYVSRRTDPTTRYQEGSLREERITAGTRWWGRGEQWDYNYEIGMQRGDFGTGAIRAWYLSTDTGWTLDGTGSPPRLGVRFNIGSGDRRAGDGTLGTFSPLFATTAYSGLSGLVGPSNGVALAPSVTWTLDDTKTLTVGVINFWRQSLGDGIYNIFSEVQRPPNGSQARHVGTQSTVTFVWQVTSHASWLTTLSYFSAGQFLKESPPAENVTYFTTWWAYRF